MKRALYQLLPRLVPMKYLVRFGRQARRVENLLKRGRLIWPFDVAIELERSCNRSCWYCPQSQHKHENQEIGDVTFHLALHRLAEVDWDGQLFFSLFNEPFANPRIVERIGQARQALPKALINCNTNGDYLTQDLLSRAFKAGLDRVVVTRHPPFNDKWNFRVSQLASLFYPKIRIQQLEAKILRNVAGLIPGLVTGKPITTPCWAPQDVLVIRTDGTVGLCCCDYNREVTMGHIAHERIDDIWDSQRYKQIRRELAHGVRTLSICKNCNGSFV